MLINFTDHRGNEQNKGAQLVAVRTAFRDSAEDIENAQDIFMSSVERATDRLRSLLEHILDFVEDAERERLRGLLRRAS